MFLTARQSRIRRQVYTAGGGKRQRCAFTLVELIVVTSIIALLTAILIPTVATVRRQARALVSMNNLKEITAAVGTFASDNAQRYPPSVATVGMAESWNWQEPTMLTGYLKRTPALHRSISAYLHAYIDDADVMFCPSAPAKYKYRQEAWDAGDDWDHPETSAVPDPVVGTYCFYWNYVGFLADVNSLFIGPSGPARGYRESSIVVTDYFGYDCWRCQAAYGSCERLPGAQVADGTSMSSAYWSCSGSNTAKERDGFVVRLQAAYVDGHVESYSPAETRPMKVILNPRTGEPYPDDTHKGTFYIPRMGVR
ncbi:MAG: type II secretion system protein [Sedimentisphaerales bacterium]|nr:type II secretion system protein [Sedimentisphaerales bacterium]